MTGAPVTAEELAALESALARAKTTLARVRNSDVPREQYADFEALVHLGEVNVAVTRAVILRAQLGQDHPETLAAIVDAVLLAEPGFLERGLAECGIAPLKADYVSDDGQLLFSADAIANAFGVPIERVNSDIERLAGEGAVRIADGANRLQ